MSSLGATHGIFCGNNLTLRVYAWDFCYAHCRYARQHVFGAGLGSGPLDRCAKVFYRLSRHESSDFPRNVRLLYSWCQLTSASWINRKTALLQLLRDCTFLPIVLMQQLLAVPLWWSTTCAKNTTGYRTMQIAFNLYFALPLFLCSFHILMTSTRQLEFLHRIWAAALLSFLVLATSRPVVVVTVSHQLSAKDRHAEYV